MNSSTTSLLKKERESDYIDAKNVHNRIVSLDETKQPTDGTKIVRSVEQLFSRGCLEARPSYKQSK